MTDCRDIPELEAFVGKRGSAGRAPLVMMFGSSYEADEKIYADWLCERKNVKAVIVPYEFDIERLIKLKEIVAGETVLMSELCEQPSDGDGKRVLIMDCFGLLSRAYAYADVAYIGGGFGVSVHNISEAAIYGIPVMFGPENSNLMEAEELKTLGGGMEITGLDSFRRKADRMLFDVKERERRGRWAGEYMREKT